MGADALVAAAGAVEGPPDEVERLVRTAGRVSDHARRLRDAIAEVPVEQIERRLAAVRGQQVAGKVELVDALAQQLAAQRRARARLDALHARLEPLLAERELAAFRSRLDELARDLEAAS